MSAVVPFSTAVTGEGLRPLIITTCSATKRSKPGLQADGLTKGSQDRVQQEWRALLERAPAILPASGLYRGRAFGFALRAADDLGADIGVVSAGLGYVRGSTIVPSYDLTVRSRVSASIRNRIDGRFNPRAWWRSVSQSHFSTSLVADAKDRSVVLICLSRDYAAMLVDELAQLAETSSNVRIFGLNISAALPESIRSRLLPYDERLSHLQLNGTRVDFPQRALLHYVSSIHPSTGLTEDRAAVERTLSKMLPIARRVQHRHTDDEIKARIRELVRQFGSKRSRILGHLRHVEEISCEQGRFSSLFDKVQSEMERCSS